MAWLLLDREGIEEHLNGVEIHGLDLIQINLLAR